MPLYEYRCRACGDTFEQLRAVTAADADVRCPAGHHDTVRMLSLVARRASTTPGSVPVQGSAPTGGCCGGGCCA